MVARPPRLLRRSRIDTVCTRAEARYWREGPRWTDGETTVKGRFARPGQSSVVPVAWIPAVTLPEGDLELKAMLDEAKCESIALCLQRTGEVWIFDREEPFDMFLTVESSTRIPLFTNPSDSDIRRF